MLNDKKGLTSSFKDGFVSLLEFVKLVGTLKLRGTSSLMIASQTVRGRIDELKNISKLSIIQEATEEKRKSLTPSYSLAGHVVDLTSEGEINPFDIRKIQTAIKLHSNHGSLPDCLIPTTSSVETFEGQTAAMYVLGVLKYFSEDYSNLTVAQTNWWQNRFGEYQSQLIQTFQRVQKIFEEEPRLLKIESPVYIIGDIHGNYQTIMAFQKWFWSAGLECSPGSVLFLGDYVDRGLNGVEVIGYLMAQKLKNPRKIFLLRGNHEIRKVQKEFTFYAECLAKFERGGLDFWNAVNDVFDRLPLAALIDNQIFCCHGGIPMPSSCESLAAIDLISCPLPDPGESKLAWSLLWNDPQKVGYNYNLGKKVVEGGFSKNTRRKTGHTFDSSALQCFIDKHNLSYVVRAHEVQEEGFQVDLNNNLITVFSSSCYRGNNKAGCILVQQNKLRIFTMIPPS
uniref:Serine/threonine-protein phosphatase n=1 Tax=Lygus hesperus TaxID=30085 RepID=A0A0A9YNC3_LYGHE